MSREARWERVKELVDAALDLPSAEREAFLRREADDDSDLFDEAWALVASAEPDFDVLEHSAAHFAGGGDPDLDDLTELEGHEVGSFRLTRELGRGGMGVVYEAERTGDVGGTVAVKLIRKGMDSALVSRRFRQERQILARLAHPNIAHFIDGGVTDEGRPYFVMERVEGTPITTFCVRHGMTVEGRVRIFLQVLDAVGLAHRNLVVHRDLKPSNVLVRDDGAVKLLDFGVAKVLGDEPGTDATLTRVGGRVLTPSYSAPEQIRGEPVSTAADIYSLGVILYELLAGRTPFLLDTAPMSEVQRVVSYEEPTRPSHVTRGSGKESVEATHARRRRLSGDLDAILLKALRKEPDKRYASAGEFHADLCRFLDHRPVLARRGTLPYRVERFIQRNRTGVVATAIILIVLLAGGAYGWRKASETARQMAIAGQRVEDVRALMNSMLFEVHDAVADLPGSTGARKLILDRAHERLDEVTRSVPENPDLLIDLAGAYRRLGEVEGRPTGPSLGDLSAARASFEQGLELARRALAGDSSDLVKLRDVGLLHERLASTLAFSGYVAEGVDHSRQAQAIYERIATAHPDSARHQLTAVIGRINLSDLEGHPHFPNLGATDAALAGYRLAERRLSSPPLLNETSYGVRRYRGLVEERLARMLRLTGEYAASDERYRASLAIRTALHEDFPTDDEAWRDVGVTHQNLCMVAQGLGQIRTAQAECATAMDVYETRFRADSLNAQTLADLASIHDSYQELYLGVGDTVQALGHLQAMQEWAERKLLRDPTSLPDRQTRLDALLTRALILVERGAPFAELGDALVLAAELQAEGHLAEDDAERAEQLRTLAAR